MAMELDEFRRHGHAFVDWMADYLASVERRPVRSRARPGDVAARLPEAPPAEGEPMARIFADFERIVLPGMTHWQHPNFFAYFPANSSPLGARRDAHGDPRRPVHAVADLARGDRDGDPGARLAAPDDRPARGLRRGDPGFGLVGDALRDPDRARAGDRVARQ